jgi:predicted nucleotidyltransferase
MHLLSHLDTESRALLQDVVNLLLKQHGNIIDALIVFGSVARGAERPTDDPYPSDIDLLVICTVSDETIWRYHGDLFHTIGDAHRMHMDAPREVNVMFATRTLQEWDPDFIANVARDGIVLYANGPLPAALVAA